MADLPCTGMEAGFMHDFSMHCIGLLLTEAAA